MGARRSQIAAAWAAVDVLGFLVLFLVGSKPWSLVFLVLVALGLVAFLRVTHPMGPTKPGFELFFEVEPAAKLAPIPLAAPPVDDEVAGDIVILTPAPAPDDAAPVDERAPADPGADRGSDEAESAPVPGTLPPPPGPVVATIVDDAVAALETTDTAGDDTVDPAPERVAELIGVEAVLDDDETGPVAVIEAVEVVEADATVAEAAPRPSPLDALDAVIPADLLVVPTPPDDEADDEPDGEADAAGPSAADGEPDVRVEVADVPPIEDLATAPMPVVIADADADADAGPDARTELIDGIAIVVPPERTAGDEPLGAVVRTLEDIEAEQVEAPSPTTAAGNGVAAPDGPFEVVEDLPVVDDAGILRASSVAQVAEFDEVDEEDLPTEDARRRQIYLLNKIRLELDEYE